MSARRQWTIVALLVALLVAVGVMVGFWLLGGYFFSPHTSYLLPVAIDDLSPGREVLQTLP